VLLVDFATIGYSSLTVASSSESHAVYSSDSWYVTDSLHYYHLLLSIFIALLLLEKV